MKEIAGKIAVVTGAATGMGREISRLLATGGCHLALCDVSIDQLEMTRALCLEVAPAGTRVSTSTCDVADEPSVLAFRDEVKRQHATEHINLLFNNAGISGGASFINDSRESWERTFDVCFFGVYFCTRAFMPMLIASEEAHLVNTSSVNGFWACLGPDNPNAAYCTAKFAVKGFTEALIVDTRINAPHVKVSLVMPGHVGTPIVENSQRLLTNRTIAEMNAEDLQPWRVRAERQGITPAGVSDEALRADIQRVSDQFRDKAPTSARQAAEIILQGVREERWRILVGLDAIVLDAAVRAVPEEAYESSFLGNILKHSGRAKEG
jgi:NAD(P)-dependent dehydrogenase (short-subunit alcohol dehydrogenase family)